MTSAAKTIRAFPPSTTECSWYPKAASVLVRHGDRRPRCRLSPREWDVLTLLVDGHSDRQIADALLSASAPPRPTSAPSCASSRWARAPRPRCGRCARGLSEQFVTR
ncbi:MAG: LuxR C-terminal-related transcriptional regulator [Thermomicrobiales bacterium]